MPKRRDSEIESSEGDSSDASVEPEPAPKAKKSKSATKQEKTEPVATKKGNKEETANGESRFDLGKKKFVTVRTFKGNLYVDIREFYEDRNTEELKPGKKGISLDVSQWKKLKSMVEEIDAATEGK